ncbi:type VI secretion system protein TssA [Thauera butanivorans]|uniref:type VI secretion system protein TssA n=1 Tax=Thauera butanivorans TaxID=86174 RepID=UPI003AB1EFFC
MFSTLTAASPALEGGPCGPDLEYAPRFLDFMASAKGKEEQQLGDAIIPAQEPDWRSVLKSGMTLAGETRDLRIAVVLTHAATQIHGLRGLADGLALILDWLSAHWETLHPALTLDGEHDPLMRTNALSYVYDAHGCLGAARQARLLESRVGALHVGDAENIIKGRTAGSAAVVATPEQLARLIADERERNAETFASLSEAASLLQQIETLWKNRLEAEFWPEFDGLRDLLVRLADLAAPPRQGMADGTQPHGADAEPASRQSTHPAVRQAGLPAPALPDAVDNRRDAFRALALARQYFEHNEPSHPAPLLIQRIEKLEGLSFAEIISELTPDGLGQLRQIAGEQIST